VTGRKKNSKLSSISEPAETSDNEPIIRFGKPQANTGIRIEQQDKTETGKQETAQHPSPPDSY
jgi:hypothetical protein